MQVISPLMPWRQEPLLVFSVTIAGFPAGLPSPRLGDWQMDFQCLRRLSSNYTYLTCRIFVCQHSVIVETTLKLPSYRVRFPTCIGKPAAIFSAVVNMSWHKSVGIPPDCVRLAERLGPASVSSPNSRRHRAAETFEGVKIWWVRSRK